MESDRRDAGETEQELPLHQQAKPVPDGPPEDPETLRIPDGMPLPSCLYVIGTVNTDETTHGFSPKVLDRAFTLEFGEVDVGRIPVGSASPEIAGSDERDCLVALLAASSEADRRGAWQRGVSQGGVLGRLSTLNALLRPHDLHFGYRTRDEVARFVGYGMESPLRDGFVDEQNQEYLDGAFDSAVVMKVPPKFHGPRAQMLGPLAAVLCWAVAPDETLELVNVRKNLLGPLDKIDQTNSPVDALILAAARGSKPALPRVAEKTARMLFQAMTTGFTSFS